MIEFDSVAKRYGDGTVAVTHISLTIEAHRITVLLGSSGSGKTTLLRMINKMVKPSAGRVLVRGSDVAQADSVELRRSIGYVMQAGGLLPHRSVLDNIATVPLLSGTAKAAARAAARELLERVGLEDKLAERYPAQLSGGQQQRVGVARALAADPDILLMDEPFGAVDPIVRRSLQDELLRLQGELAKTIVLVTHDVDEALRLGDQIVVLKQGGVIAQAGSPVEVLSEPADDFVAEFVGATSAARAIQVVEAGNQRIAVDSIGRPLGVLPQ